MPEKWGEKEVLEGAEQLRSPFDKIKQNGQGRGLIPNIGGKIKELIGRNKGIRAR